MEYMPATDVATTNEEREAIECNRAIDDLPEIRYLHMITVWEELRYGLYRVLRLTARWALKIYTFVMQMIQKIKNR